MNEFRANRVVREPNRPLRAAALAFFLGALALFVLTVAMNVQFGGIAADLAICAAPIYFASAWTNAGARGRSRDVRATAAGVTFDAKAIARSKIADGLAAWQRSLTQLADQGAGYRRAAIASEDLWRVVEDPRAPVDARAAAALVLRSSLDDGGKARVRLAAEATASPKLRIALDTAATGTDDELGAALQEMEDEIERERSDKTTKA